MKIIKIAYRCLFLLSIAGLLSCSGTQPMPGTVATPAGTDNSLAHGLLWRLEKQGQTSFLFATLHLEDERVTRLPARVQQAFTHAEALVLEIKLNQASRRQAGAAMLFRDGRSLLSVAGEDLFQQAASALRARGFARDHVLTMKPWAVFALLSLPKPQTGLFLDALLYQQALRHGKAIYALETIEEQIAIFDGLSEREQLILLRDTLAHHDQIPRLIEHTLEVYLSGDLPALLALNRRYLAFTEPSLARRLERRLLHERNYRMLERLEILLASRKSLFIAVGALHLPGEHGLLNLLRKQGYRVTSIRA